MTPGERGFGALPASSKYPIRLKGDGPLRFTNLCPTDLASLVYYPRPDGLSHERNDEQDIASSKTALPPDDRARSFFESFGDEDESRLGIGSLFRDHALGDPKTAD